MDPVALFFIIVLGIMGAALVLMMIFIFLDDIGLIEDFLDWKHRQPSRFLDDRFKDAS